MNGLTELVREVKMNHYSPKLDWVYTKGIYVPYSTIGPEITDMLTTVVKLPIYKYAFGFATIRLLDKLKVAPREFKMGLIAHELSHIAVNEEEKTEFNVDDDVIRRGLGFELALVYGVVDIFSNSEEAKRKKHYSVEDILRKLTRVECYSVMNTLRKLIE